MDFRDSDKRELIWRGSVSAVVDSDAGPEKGRKESMKLSRRILRNFLRSNRNNMIKVSHSVPAWTVCCQYSVAMLEVW